jgi:Flp pilus assembly pilin Flp
VALQLRQQELLTRLDDWLGGRRPGAAEAGQSTVEYAAICAVIVVVAIAAMNMFGGGVGQVFGRLLARIQGLG